MLEGEQADTNTAAIGRILGAHGYRIRESLTVGDVEADIEEALEDLGRRRDAVIVTGGLGPTSDDLTARVAARVFKRRLTLNEEALRQIGEHFQKLGRPMHPRNEKQALLPQKVQVLPNSRGTAPGFYLSHQGKGFFFLPGVPDEMEAMLEASVIPRLRERSGVDFPQQEKVFKIFGLSEPKVEELLESATLPEGVHLAFGVEFPLVLVKLRAQGQEAGSLLAPAEETVRKILGNFLIAVGRDTPEETVARMFHRTGRTLALAESCTGGLVAKRLTDLPGASAFLERAAVTYANSAKRDWLAVPGEVLDKDGAVSRPCALAMARGIRRAAGTDLGLSITGIAGPEGGTPEKPVGTVFIALASETEEKVQGYRFPGDREKVRLLAATMALEWLRRYLGALPPAEPE